MGDAQLGLFRATLHIGAVAGVRAASVRVNLSRAGASNGHWLDGTRYGLGEVGELVLIEGEESALLGRIDEVRLPERERLAVSAHGDTQVDAIGEVQLLGTVQLDDLSIEAGVSGYPRLGDRVYAAPAWYVAEIPSRIDGGREDPGVRLRLGRVAGEKSAPMFMSPDRLFGRHCAILGATGGGKSFTLSRLIEQCARYQSKLILIDATGEFADLPGVHVHLGRAANAPATSRQSSLPPTSFIESDFTALFQPSSGVQGPKMRAAIRSLRLVRLKPDLADKTRPGLLVKENRTKATVFAAEREAGVVELLDNPEIPFDVTKLAAQIVEECVHESANFGRDSTKWGDKNQTTVGYCETLFTRIHGALVSRSLECVFGDEQGEPVTAVIDEFLGTSDSLLTISLEGVDYEYSAREIIANAIGRYLLRRARENAFVATPLVLFMDEAHNFLGQTVGPNDASTRLDSFELLAKEGRKYGLSLCLATQRPRDVTAGVLSQMGTLIVHRLTNDQDREVIEGACGEIDRSAARFLPNLSPGEALIVGADLPIPLAIKIAEPDARPRFVGSRFQASWRPRTAETSREA